MGKVKTEQIKRLSKELITRFPGKFTTNFDDNKRMVDQLTEGTTTRIRNQTAGYITRTVVLNENQHIDEGEVVEDTSEE